MGNSNTSSVNTSVDVRKGEKNGELFEKKAVTYNVGARAAKITIKKIIEHDNERARRFIIKVVDNDKYKFQLWYSNIPYRFKMLVEVTSNQLLEVRYAVTDIVNGKDFFDNMQWQLFLSMVGFDLKRLDNMYGQDAMKKTKTNVTITEMGEIIETSLNHYRVKRRDKQQGLVVIQRKKKGGSEKPYMIIVIHYFATMFEINTGFSLTASIRGEDLQVEGPVHHPASSLFEMFKKVMRTGVWTPTSCSHCADLPNPHHSPIASRQNPCQHMLSLSDGKNSNEKQPNPHESSMLQSDDENSNQKQLKPYQGTMFSVFDRQNSKQKQPIDRQNSRQKQPNPYESTMFSMFDGKNNQQQGSNYFQGV